ncbi:MAG: hypothetical protein GY898_04515 [Proteobacteria bacterium]|nr:hypothetical protein [Pseudomonadota bacterium]
MVERPPLVVLVHGFMRSGASMLPMAVGLRRRGFVPRLVSQWNFSTEIPDLADGLFARVMRMRDVVSRTEGYVPDVHFVTHSMGGIVVRSMLSRHEIPGPNRVVMLAPPNRGSRLAQAMHGRWRFPWGEFDPVRKLLPGELGSCATAGDPDAEIGIIAGEAKGAGGFPWTMLGPASDEPHDGKVALDEARLDSAKDFIVVPRGHTFIMASPEVIEQTAAFLRDGAFNH